MDSASLRTHPFQRILLIKLSALGDVVHTIPVLNKLRRRYPDARIDWLVRPATAELIRHHPAITDIRLFTAKSSGSWEAIAAFARLTRELRTQRYDLVIDMQGQLRSAVCALATGAPVRVGFERPRRAVWEASHKRPEEAYRHAWRGAREGAWLAYTHPIRLDTLDRYAVDRNLLLAPMLGLDDAPADFSFPIPPEAVAAAERLLPEGNDRPLILIAPGTIWETKHWKAERYAAVARHFLAKGARVAVIGSPDERAVCRQVADGAPGTIDLAGRTSIMELAAVLARASVCVTNDSGPMHLAVALDRPVVGIFGPTDALWAGPYRRPESVVRTELPCAPCYLRRLRQCPNDHRCMETISADAVIERVDAMLTARTA